MFGLKTLVVCHDKIAPNAPYYSQWKNAREIYYKERRSLRRLSSTHYDFLLYREQYGLTSYSDNPTRRDMYGNWIDALWVVVPAHPLP